MYDVSEIFPVKDFIRPEDLFVYSVSLLFNEDNSREQHAAKIKSALNSANLYPRRLVISNKRMVIECDCELPIDRLDPFEYSLQYEFYRVFEHTLCWVPAGTLTSELMRGRTTTPSYTFKQDL